MSYEIEEQWDADEEVEGQFDDADSDDSGENKTTADKISKYVKLTKPNRPY